MFSLAAPPTLPRPYEAASFAEHFSQIPFCHAITVKPVFYCIWNRSHMVVFSMNKQYKKIGCLYFILYYTKISIELDFDVVINLMPILLSSGVFVYCNWNTDILLFSGVYVSCNWKKKWWKMPNLKISMDGVEFSCRNNLDTYLKVSYFC